MAYRVGVYSFSERGRDLANKICRISCDTFRCEKLIVQLSETTEITEEIFNSKSAHVFIGASGIAVRKIAPFINSKLSDPAVLVIDENGQYVIPVLSGHIGGANSLARIIAEFLNAKAVITTATDVNGIKAVDCIAAESRLKISDKMSIRHANSKLLKGDVVNVYADDDVEIICNDSEHYRLSSIEDADIIIDSSEKYIIGVGCRKSIGEKVFSEVLNNTLNEFKIEYSEIDRIASIDIKADEKAIINYCKKYNIMFETYSKDELGSVQGDFDESDFVKEITGVSNVSERAAYYGKNLCGSGDFILKRKSEDGVTISIVKVRKRLNLNGNS